MLLVICMHHSLLVEIGWTGVDLFFVLSGFLITGILMRVGVSRHIGGRFYMKRAVRLFIYFLSFSWQRLYCFGIYR